MNEADTVDFDDTNSSSRMVRDRGHRLHGRAGAQRPADQPRRRTDAAPDATRAPDLQQHIRTFRHGVTAAIYLGLAYAAKMAFGISIAFNAMR